MLEFASGRLDRGRGLKSTPEAVYEYQVGSDISREASKPLPPPPGKYSPIPYMMTNDYCLQSPMLSAIGLTAIIVLMAKK